MHGGEAAPASAPLVEPARPTWRADLGACLGRGGFASVWEVGAERVLKVAHVAHDLARARLAREAEAMRAIGAPAVPALHDAGTAPDGRAWIEMDRVTGQTIGDVMAVGPTPIAMTLDVGIALAGALEPIHAAGFIHRDLKPDNAIYLGPARCVILDLGLARRFPSDPNDPTRANVQVGSLEYMAPEQLADAASVDPRSDLYAVGCILYELCTGRPPFLGDAAALERAHTALRPPRLAGTAGVSSAIEAAIMDCLAKDRARRPASARALRDRLAHVQAERSPVRMSHSVSVIREGKQPVVLVWTELARVDRQMLSIFSARRMSIVSQRGRRILAGVVGGEHADPAAVGLAVARELAAAGARVALHLDAVRVTSAGGAITLADEPVEKPETWLPHGAWAGVALTRAFAAITQAPTRTTAELGDGHVALADDASHVEVVGRDGLLTDLIADAMGAIRAIDNGAPLGPGFAVVVGDPGVGKTALARELARRLGELGVRVHLGAFAAPGTARPGQGPLVELIGNPEGPTVRVVGDALRAEARKAPIAMILDDLHYADAEMLDALEYATLGGEPMGLWVLGIASPRIDARRPNLGVRAERHRRDVLPPLDEEAAVALTAALLRPAEYPPLRALRKIVDIAKGNPLHLAVLARDIHERGAVRARPGGAHFLDTTALDELAPVALGPWLAARELAGLAPELVALARVCAVVGGELVRDELVAVVEEVERRGGATTNVDVDVGLGELARAGILVATQAGFRFGQTLVEEGVYATTDETERLVIHQVALEQLQRTRRDVEQLAHHAEAVGAREVAAAAYAELAEVAHRSRRLIEADQSWQGVLRNLDHCDRSMVHALAGRASARSRQQRQKDAFADLERALEIARGLGDNELVVEVMFQFAHALDLGDEFARSRQLGEAANAMLAEHAVRREDLILESGLTRGRNHFRAQEYAPAVEHLVPVFERARATDQYDIAVAAGLLLGPSLAQIHELDEAEEVFRALISECSVRDDRFHLGAAYGNRAWLWSAKGESDRSAADLRLVIQLAREVGHAMLERAATYNLAEDLLWQGDLDNALALGRRSCAIQAGHGEGASRFDQLLIARILAAQGANDEMASIVRQLDSSQMDADERAMLRVLELLLVKDDAISAWASVMAEARRLPESQELELYWLALRHGVIAQDFVDRIRVLALKNTIWRPRFLHLIGGVAT